MQIIRLTSYIRIDDTDQESICPAWQICMMSCSAVVGIGCLLSCVWSSVALEIVSICQYTSRDHCQLMMIPK